MGSGRWPSQIVCVEDDIRNLRMSYSTNGRQHIFGCFHHPLPRPKYPFTPHSDLFLMLTISFDFLLTFSVQSGSHFSGSRTFCFPVPAKLPSAATTPQLNLEYTTLRLFATPRRTKQTQNHGRRRRTFCPRGGQWLRDDEGRILWGRCPPGSVPYDCWQTQERTRVLYAKFCKS